MFDTVLIAGLGLMGGSMAKTIKARTLSRVLGLEPHGARPQSRHLADGSIDAIATGSAVQRGWDLLSSVCFPQTVDWLLENMPKMKRAA